MSEKIRGPWVNRPAASATWEHDYRWGHQLGDVRSLRVTRTDGGQLVISYGRDSVRLDAEVVAQTAEMVAAAADWTDTPTPGADVAPTDTAAEGGGEESE